MGGIAEEGKKLYDSLQEDFKVKRRRFMERDAQAVHINKLILVRGLIISLMFFLTYLVQIMEGSWMALGASVLTVVVLVVSFVIFKKDESAVRLRYVMVFGYLLSYIYLMVTSNVSITYAFIFPIVSCAILFYDVKFMKMVSGATIALILIRVAFVFTKAFQAGFSSQEALVRETVLSAILVIIFMMTVLKATRVAHQFNHDTVYTMRDEQKKSNIMLKEILHTASVVEEGAEDVGRIMDQLQKSSENVFTSLTEITTSTQLTAENVQEQTMMTQNIQEAISDTVQLSGEMVHFAENTSEVIQTSLGFMEEMKNQAQNIADTNSHVSDSMNKLQDKTKEVQEIARIIFDISSKTNMLALNASIESARAGEAGRSFAVVADRIRQLAEQTRKSMESITSIVNELNENAGEAAAAVTESVSATVRQNEMIRDASESFRSVSREVGSLNTSIEHLDRKLGDLRGSNDVIVENISQLSATTEEVTASSQTATEYSGQNSKDADSAKALLAGVLETVHSLNKYKISDVTEDGQDND